MNYSPGDIIELTIDRLSYEGGRGVGRHNNFVFFVPNTAPGETIRAQVTHIKKNFGEATLTEIISASPARRKAPCPVAEVCGGCVWQHITYAEQLKQKQNILSYQLRELLPAHLTPPKIEASPNEFRYRNRVQLHTRKDATGTKTFGFYKKGTNEIAPITDCLIAEENIFKNLTPAQLEGKKTEVAITSTGERVFRNLDVGPGEFTQVHTAQNKYMQNYVTQLAQAFYSSNPQITHLYDLYCGSGNLTFPLARAFSKLEIVGVESNDNSIRTAKSVAIEEKLTNVQFFTQDVSLYVRKMPLSQKSILVLDPPRAGLGPSICSDVLRIRPAFIIYVSCNLSTLARDLKQLGATSGLAKYTVTSIRGIDMFPQTEYVETVVTLQVLPAAL